MSCRSRCPLMNVAAQDLDRVAQRDEVRERNDRGGIDSIGKMKPDSTMNGIMMNMTVCCACWRVCETSETSRPSPIVVNMNSNSPSTTTQQLAVERHAEPEPAHERDDRHLDDADRARTASPCPRGTRRA